MSVFDTTDIHVARQRFNSLRRRFDFTYWAATLFHIRDIKDPDKIVPLILTRGQHRIIDIIQSHYDNHDGGRYIITKKGSPCGLTTCIQAYMIWRQQFSAFRGHLNICGASDSNLIHMKVNLCRYLGREFAHSADRINLVDSRISDFFNTVRTPDALRGIDFPYVHLADMSKWNCPEEKSMKAFVASVSGVLLDYRTLIVLEGNRPNDFPDDEDSLCQYYQLQNQMRLEPSFFIREMTYSSIKSHHTPFFHIKT